MPNVIFLSHTAFYTDDAIRFMVGGQFKSAKCYMEGKPKPRELFWKD
jgi:lactate dehydrogenase-like 2-hydroxyacid dehydrogenase